MFISSNLDRPTKITHDSKIVNFGFELHNFGIPNITTKTKLPIAKLKYFVFTIINIIILKGYL